MTTTIEGSTPLRRNRRRSRVRTQTTASTPTATSTPDVSQAPQPTTKRSSTRTRTRTGTAAAPRSTNGSTPRSGPSRTRGTAGGNRPMPPKSPSVLAEGTYSAHPRGFGFVRLDTPIPVAAAENGLVDSAFVTPIDARELFAGDRVQVRVDVSDGRGTVVHLMSSTRARTRVFGHVIAEAGRFYLVPDPNVASGKVKLPAGAQVTAGEWVLWDLRGRTVVTRFDALTPATVRAMVFERHQFPLHHNQSVINQADRLAAQVTGRLAGAVGIGRTDYTGVTTVTIDGPTSKDLDDAISAAVVADGIRVWVHVADVASAVPAGSAVDKAARETGTSVYLPGWNRPMLPSTLSEQAVSLLPGVPRETVTVAYTVTDDGSVRDIDVTLGRVVSDAQLTYQGTSAVLAGTEKAPNQPIGDLLTMAAEAAARLGRERDARSDLATDYSSARLTDPSVHTTTAADPYAGATFTSTPTAPAYATEQLIERLMVAANESVCAWLTARDLPGLFRVHGSPSVDLLDDLVAFSAHAEGPQAQPFTAADPVARYLELIGRSDSASVTDGAKTLLMRHTSRAEYTATAGDHYGLGSTGYLHFTSPLRRYADLLVHRVVHAHLAGRTAELAELAELIGEMSAHLSERSSAAGRVESGFLRYATAEVFAPATRGTVEAIVSGFSPKAVFVTDPATGLSGQLPLAKLDDRWTVDARKVAVRSTAGKVVHLGDRMPVRLTAVDPATADVSFAPARRAS